MNRDTDKEPRFVYRQGVFEQGQRRAIAITNRVNAPRMKARREEVARLAPTHTRSEIAEAVGVSETTVSLDLRALGVECVQSRKPGRGANNLRLDEARASQVCAHFAWPKP